ncbi:hypothetical protein BaRGS_00005709 [Batillaria attramentaria]|uniref:Uncharacterized protein n=1 Tax=Batillaria attramentaria TaxID=370345 RepID=A0ABD0LV39_9CAEN
MISSGMQASPLNTKRGHHLETTGISEANASLSKGLFARQLQIAGAITGLKTYAGSQGKRRISTRRQDYRPVVTTTSLSELLPLAHVRLRSTSSCRITLTGLEKLK